MRAKSWMTTSGKAFSLDQLPTERVVLYFYPKDNTSGCTLEAKQFSVLLPEFQKLGVTVYGVSRDSLKSHESFREKQSLSVELISDPEESLCRHFDVIKEKNMYGKKVLGIERSTFVLNRHGEVLKEWRKVKADGHAAEVLEWLKSGDEDRPSRSKKKSQVSRKP